MEYSYTNNVNAVNGVNGVSKDKIDIIMKWSQAVFDEYSAWSGVQDKGDPGVKFLFKLSNEMLDRAMKRDDVKDGIMTAEFFLPPENDYPGLREEEQWDDQHYIRYEIRLVDSTELNGWLSKEELDGDELPEVIGNLRGFYTPANYIKRVIDQLYPPLPPRQ